MRLLEKHNQIGLEGRKVVRIQYVSDFVTKSAVFILLYNRNSIGTSNESTELGKMRTSVVPCFIIIVVIDMYYYWIHYLPKSDKYITYLLVNFPYFFFHSELSTV